MLSVVDAFTGFAIEESRGPATQPSARFQDEHLDPVLGEHGRRTQTGEAGADDDDGVQRPLPAIVVIQVRSAMSARLGREIRTTCAKTS